jgi:hypothetical protein
MAQSGQAYGVEQPKSTARSPNHRDPETTAGPQPACRDAARDGCEWRTAPYSDGLVGIYPLCERCFGGGDAPSIGESVVMSRNRPSVIHRLCDGTEQSEAVETRTHRFQNVVKTDETVDALASLREGDGVVWRTQQIPLRVVGVSEVQLRGPEGGEYVLKREDGAYRIYPGYGHISELTHVRLDNSQERFERGTS